MSFSQSDYSRFGGTKVQVNPNTNSDYSRFGGTKVQQPKPQEEPDILPQEQSQKSDTGEDLKQRSLSFGAHALGAVAALPANIRDLAYEGGKQAQELRKKIYDKMGMNYDEDFLKNDSIKNFDESVKAPFRFIVDKLPNSEDVNKFIDESFGGYLAPKDEKQKLANSIGEDIVNSALNRSPKSLIRNFAIPIGANIIKKGAELFGVDPSSSEVLKMLSWVGADMASISNTRGMLANRFSQTRRLAGANDMINVNPRDLRFLDQLERDMTSGGASPSSTAALTKVRELRDAMQGGQISARQQLDFYRTTNELLGNFGAFSVEGAGGKANHVRRLNQVQQLNRNMLNRYGMNQNPRFLESFRENNLAWAAMEASNGASSYIKKNYAKPFVSDITKGFFMGSPGKGLAIAGGLTALERMGAFVSRLQNPVLRRYYGDVLSNSLSNNRAGMIKSLNNFDKAAAQFEKESDEE